MLDHPDLTSWGNLRSFTAVPGRRSNCASLAMRRVCHNFKAWYKTTNTIAAANGQK
jgi:hypothetical protein